MFRRFTSDNQNYQEGRNLLEIKDYEQAIVLFQVALTEGCRYQGLVDDLVSAYINQSSKLITEIPSSLLPIDHQVDNIINLLTQADNFCSNNSANKFIINFNKGYTYYISKDYVTAADCFKQSIENNYRTADSAYQLSLIYENLSNQVESLKYAELSARIEPANIDYSQNYALLLKQFGEAEKSILEFENIAKLPMTSEQEIKILYHLNTILLAQSNVDLYHEKLATYLTKLESLLENADNHLTDIDKFKFFVNKNLGLHHGFMQNNLEVAKKYLTTATELGHVICPDFADEEINQCLSHIQTLTINDDTSLTGVID